MQQNWTVYRAMIDCPYKAWQLAKSELPEKLQPEPYMVGNEIIFPSITLSADDKLALAASFSKHIIGQNRIKILYSAAGTLNKMATSVATNNTGLK